LATDEGLCPTGAEILKRVGHDRARHIIRFKPRSGLLDRVIRGARITDDGRINETLYRAKKPLNNPGLILDHGQENDFMVRHVYLGYLPLCVFTRDKIDEL
jgi:hypothetical protein